MCHLSCGPTFFETEQHPHEVSHYFTTITTSAWSLAWFYFTFDSLFTRTNSSALASRTTLASSAPRHRQTVGLGSRQKIRTHINRRCLSTPPLRDAHPYRCSMFSARALHATLFSKFGCVDPQGTQFLSCGLTQVVSGYYHPFLAGCSRIPPMDATPRVAYCAKHSDNSKHRYGGTCLYGDHPGHSLGFKSQGLPLSVLPC